MFGNNGFRSNLKRLLFVDDEPNIRATLPTILRRYGFTVAVAGTVSQALDQIKNHAFGLLLCDLNIEREGDGYIVIRSTAKKPREGWEEAFRAVADRAKSSTRI